MENYKTIHKLFWAWNFEKEELWLNEMANNGWVLDGVAFCTYKFVQCEPGEYTIRFEAHEKDGTYLQFMQETGAEYIGRMVQWIYFRKKTTSGGFDLFSDIDSRIWHLDKIGKITFVIAMSNLVIGLVNYFNVVQIGWINLLCGALLTYGLGRLHGKKEALEKERVLHE